MQTTVTKDMAFGFPGDHANGQPFRADSYVASSEVTFGKPAFADGVEGDTKKAKATGSDCIGMFVGAHQHIKFELPSDSRSITVPAGTTVAVAAKGSWYAEVAGWSAAVALGDKVKVASNDWAKAGDSDTVVAEIIALGDATSVTASGSTTYGATVVLRFI